MKPKKIAPDRRYPHRHNGCEDPHCPGWLVTLDLEIERCDTCSVFEDDDDAREAALQWLHDEWVKNATRARMRRESRPK